MVVSGLRDERLSIGKAERPVTEDADIDRGTRPT